MISVQWHICLYLDVCILATQKHSFFSSPTLKYFRLQEAIKPGNLQLFCNSDFPFFLSVMKKFKHISLVSFQEKWSNSTAFKQLRKWAFFCVTFVEDTTLDSGFITLRFIFLIGGVIKMKRSMHFNKHMQTKASYIQQQLKCFFKNPL